MAGLTLLALGSVSRQGQAARRVSSAPPKTAASNGASRSHIRRHHQDVAWFEAGVSRHQLQQPVATICNLAGSRPGQGWNSSD